jgi:hypothetical protein
MFIMIAGIKSGHGFEPSGSVVIQNVACCGRSRLLNGPCERNFGIICNEKGLYIKSKRNGMVFVVLLWLGGFL